MLKAGESSNFLMDNSSNGLEQFGFDEDGEYGSMSIDLDTLYDIIDEKGDNDSTEPLQTCSEDSLKSASPGEAVLGAPNNPENTGLETDLMGPGAVHSWYNSGVSNCKIGLSSCSFGSTPYNDLSGNNRVQGSPVNTNSASIKDFISLVPGNGACFTERAGFTLPTSSTTSSFAQRDADNIPDFGKIFDVNTSQGETETQFMNTVVEINPQCAFPYPGPKNIGVNLCKYGTSGENIETVESPENILHDLYSQDITSNESSICLSNDIMSGYPALQYERGIDDQLFRSCNSQILTTNEELKNHVKDKEFPTESACSSTKMKLNGHLGRIEKYETGVLMNNYLDVEGWNYHYEVEANDYISPMESSFFDANGYHIDEKVPTQPFSSSQSYMYSEERVKDERPQEMLVTSRSIWPPVNVLDEAVSREQSFSADTKMFSKDPKSSFSASSRSLSTQKTEKLMDSKEDMVFASKKLCHPHNFMSSTSSVHTGNLSLNAQGQYMPFVPSFPICNNQSNNVVSQVSKVSPESSHSNFSEKSIVEDDSDICIIEDISHPAPISAPLNRSVAFKNTVVSSHYSTSSDNHVGVGGRVKAKDERVILRLLQDLSQPKSEISPPDGSLAVPLLRHQRIALSWMVQKETDNTHCSGGILADDQGLGKTVSTIALILKEKPPSLCHVKQDEVEPLNLDEDDDVLRGVKQESNALFCMSNETPMRSMKPLVLAKGRPAAGTLIVCPTSVLRQWDDELRNKVTSKASLSVLVYHGSNRTKDPSELAKYDVVLTTYSIVSMEVPKQPRVDEDDEEKGKPKDLVGQKRKNPPGSDKRRSDKKGSDNALLESVARPLAKVGWFRVVLDEAQSIKNHRTQVARACWGLRAKRRWCLSGTPIQNAIDDLYSYFRFLKYDPYDAYKLFCSYIKNPISKNPTNGYKKLQTVLKTIMLRRTKGTLLDGEPIINLPPKRVELKKVEFSKEERDFYSRLEADSRAQFEEYANAGTVKQNYVNILLMLLRLRQACDHPFLVKGVDSHSLWNSSVEMARKLPREEQENLLKCLEVSLAICRICNDPPEDAVVAKCGHVFCNQCLSEQLSGDDPGCPVTNCKARLNASSVFSKATLDSCLRDQSCEDNLAGCSRPEVVETGESCNDGHLYNSSKIKAALDVLKSLCGQQDSSPQNGSALESSPQNGSALDSSAQIGSALDSSPQIGFALDSSPHNGSVQSTLDGNASSVENSIDTCAVELPKDIHDSQSSDADKGCSTAIKVAGQKAIVFSQWTRMLDLLEACLKDSSIKYRRLDGTMSVTARDKAVKDFNTMPEVTVMIMSLKAASLGLNMVAACHVLLLDLWWNPTTEDQAIDRAHRIGQTRPVTVLRLTVRDTVEDRILALQQKKREMVASAFGEDENGGRQSRLTVEDLKYLFMM